MAQPGYSSGHGPITLTSEVNAFAGAGSADKGANHTDATQNSFDHNRRTIPGLGLGFFGRADSSAAKQNGAPASQKPKRANTNVGDSAEEGEITADEFEDLYESQQPVHIAQQEQPPPEIDTSYVEMSDEERERSGSYSPFLEAGEMDVSPSDPVQMPTRDRDTLTVHSAAAVQKRPIDVIAEAKIKAKDAILRLQAANIRYQDYVDEGIDKTVLDQLFGDLGLEKSSKKPTPAPPATTHTHSNQTSTAASTATTVADASADKSESRKDRIARLLAAKGSKATKSGEATVIGKVAKPLNMKVNSEKSKLLQQKMEALLKAREEKQKELERQTAIAASGPVSNGESSFGLGHGAPPVELSSALQVVASDQTAKATISEPLTSASSPAKALATSNSGTGSASEGPFQKPFGPTRPFLIDVSDDDDDIDMDMESPEQLANIERELKEGLEEEQKLREDLDYISDDDIAISAVPDSVALRAVPDHIDTEPVASADMSGQGLANPIDMLSSDHIATESSSRSSPEPVAGNAVPFARSNRPGMQSEASQKGHPVVIGVATASTIDADVAMEEATSSGEEADDDSDGYEPAEASPFQTHHSSPNVKTSDGAPELTDSDPAVAALSAELLSAGRQDSAPVAEQEREVRENVLEDTDAASVQPSYLAYDSPLRYFHSFRFHPDFSKVVAGGLRSVTFSNKIDAKLPLCPDELAGNTCPRGKNCHFQHFAEMNAPDDQILLQLGAYTNCEESRKQEYIQGLRELLTDYRNRKVKDFKTISQGIIEYRARFHGDASKVLPLGTLSL
ncbi:hypothetical protein LMH87_002182 [Akanthomyces muscarius]|uniref:C3H1-type domain-containing protein n=1 Tax=Akanthomyces muscarius TaxID=2231603 RepID=A0A9W8Q6B9_AKAMU|nr:hypothetical protein LMH87_002182 [Akanthomyces muscarius]KAJ4147674.1 hypothetical protein LMH87_002182 [Akanthomyces muscarius]